ncbi:hypothetical protein Cni_G10297 [Canna indica]|uniref:Uncharacterized protein n=1 Tax=Canna indica TaxID=4628 RepID=A0AAQ3K5W3_9LILI|nr:hypothetical protein Cni_G10297 [Canna indica]
MRPSSLLRTFSLNLISTKLSPSPVAPWPPVRTDFDRWLTSELAELRLVPFSCGRYTSSLWLCKALDVAVAAQEMTAEFIASAGGRLSATTADRKLVDGYLEDVVELLDSCNGLRERLEDIEKYSGFISTALRYLEGRHERSEGAVRRAAAALAACEAMERRCAELEKCGSGLRKLGEKIAAYDHAPPPSDQTRSSELQELLCGSRAVALLVVAALGIAVSFKTRRGLPVVQSSKAGPWGAKLHELHREVKEEFDKKRRGGLVVLDELDVAAGSARGLRDAIARRDLGEMRMLVELARRRGRELEERVRPLGEKLKGKLLSRGPLSIWIEDRRSLFWVGGDNTQHSNISLVD